MRSEAQVAVAESVKVLLTEVIHYAGLFPPAALEMRDAVENFARYKNSAHGWMLGGFVVSAERLAEFESHLKANKAPSWSVSVLLGSDVKAELKSIVEFHLKAGERAHVDSVEFVLRAPEELNPIAELLPHDVATYAEISPRGNLAEQLAALRLVRVLAKIRTGGMTGSMFPTLQQVSRFIGACATAGVPFKASAGLHHALRGVRPLTYAARSPHAPMHGFLNVLVAAAAAKAGAMELQLPEILSARDSAGI